MAPRATKPAAGADPLADLREDPPAGLPTAPTAEQEAAAKALEAAAAAEDGAQPAVLQYEVTADKGAAVAAIAQAWHADRFLSNGLHKGGQCQCVRLAHVALGQAMKHASVMARPIDGEEGTGAA